MHLHGIAFDCFAGAGYLVGCFDSEFGGCGGGGEGWGEKEEGGEEGEEAHFGCLGVG